MEDAKLKTLLLRLLADHTCLLLRKRIFSTWLQQIYVLDSESELELKLKLWLELALMPASLLFI